MNLSRRGFLESIPLGGFAAHAALAAKVDKKTGMPTRVLGKTGVRVSVVGMGCGSRLLAYQDEDKALAALDKAMSMGINYLDSAYGYGNGKSETWVGKALKGRRKGIFVVTKLGERNGDKARKILEDSLKRLQVEQIDLVHVHSLRGPDDLAAVEAKDGVLNMLRGMRDQKVIRFIGVTSHSDPVALKTALERHDFDCTQMALNAALVGMADSRTGMVINKDMKPSFELVALPVALKKKMGVTAMKIFAQEGLVGAAPVDKLIHYALSLPVAAAILGMPKLEYLDQNIQVAKAFKPLSKDEMKDLSERLSRTHKARLDHFFRDHVDA